MKPPDSSDPPSQEEPTKATKVETKTEDLPPVSFLQLFRFATPLEITLNLIGIFASVVAGAAQPLLSLIFSRRVNSTVEFGILAQIVKAGNATAAELKEFHAAANDFKHQAALDAIWFVLLGVGAFLTTALYMIIWAWTGERISRRIREYYFRSILRQDVAYFDRLGAGEVTTRISSDTHLIQQGISEKVPMIASALGAFFTGYIVAYVRSWRLALAMTSVLPASSIAGAILQRLSASLTKESLKHVAEGGSFAEEVFSTIRTTKAFGIQARVADVYNEHVVQTYKADRKLAKFTGLGIGALFFCVYGSYGLAFSFGTTLILQGHGDVGTLVNVFMSILIGSFSLAALAPDMQAIVTALGAAVKIFATIDRVPSIDSSSTSGAKPSSVQGEITFNNVHFSYPSRPDVKVLNGISLEFTPGTTSALVGPSGGGKSTIVAMIERFYDPILLPRASSENTAPDGDDKASSDDHRTSAAGSIRLDGSDLRSLNIQWLRSQIGFVQQEPVLFSTSIWQNVAYGLAGAERFDGIDEERTRRLVKEACIKANADDFVTKLPDGYDTKVGERGFLLSGGQKQRIAIARAIVADPPILLLDEATSALDTQSEGIVQDALNRASQGRTTITVAHRLSTVKNAHRIFVIAGGSVVEAGTHAELLRHEDGVYARLVHTQALREAGATIPFDAVAAAAPPVSDEAKESIPITYPPQEDMISLRSFDEKGSQAASFISPAYETETKYSTWELIRRLAAVNPESLGVYAVGTLAAMLQGCVIPAFGVVYAKAIEGFQVTDRHQLRHNGDRSALWFFIIALGATVTMLLQIWMYQLASSKLGWKLRNMSFKAIVKQDVRWFDEEKHSTGTLVANLADAPQKIMGLTGMTLGAIVSGFTTLVAGLILGFAFGWKLSLVGLAAVPPLLSTGYIRMRVVTKKDATDKKAHEESARVACEGAGAIKTVASLKRERGCYDDYCRSLDRPMKASVHGALWGGSLFAMSQSVSFFANALMFYYGSTLLANLSYNTTQFLVCIMSITFGSLQAGTVLSFVSDIAAAMNATRQIAQTVDTKQDIADLDVTHEPTSANPGRGHIALNNIRFSYPTRPNVRVIDGVNINVKPGSYVAIVGPSGSGKSTIIQLIERFYDPSSGNIQFDGTDIARMGIQAYRQNIALVSQEPTLYAGTIRFNITLGSPQPAAEITDAEIEAACRKGLNKSYANIWEFVDSLPERLETQVGGKGSQLSGGQKQRIAIARALIRNPTLLLLDEATSALDSSSEKVVQDALDNAARGRTTIAIAHRLSTIQNADNIFYIERGRVVETGTHDQLIQRRGGYYDLVQLQALGETAP